MGQAPLDAICGRVACAPLTCADRHCVSPSALHVPPQPLDERTSTKDLSHMPAPVTEYVGEKKPKSKPAKAPARKAPSKKAPAKKK